MGNRVLLVDDDEDVRETLADYLSLHGYEVSGAENGQEALNKLRALTELPCFLLLDLMMPVMDGWKFVEVLEQDPQLQNIPVFVSTSIPDRAPAGRPVLPKPIDLGAVIAAVQSVCTGLV